MADTQIDVKKSQAPSVAEHNGDLWHAMRADMERLFDRFARSLGATPAGLLPDGEHFWPRPAGWGGFSVSVDVTDADGAYTVTAELPGIDEKDIDVSIDRGILTVKGEKRAESEQKDKDRVIRERSFGSFRRSFTLPGDVDADKIDAKFAKGVLTVVLPKTAKPAPKKIDVKAA